MGIVLCHHLQPDADLLHLLPVFGAMSVSSRSKAATICGSEGLAVVRYSPNPSAYLPIIRLLFTVLHDSLSGSFCEAGLKKLATALPSKDQYHSRNEPVVLTCSRRFYLSLNRRWRKGGGLAVWPTLLEVRALKILLPIFSGPKVACYRLTI